MLSFKFNLKANVILNDCHSMCCSRYDLGSWWVSLAELETVTASFQGRQHPTHPFTQLAIFSQSIEKVQIYVASSPL